MAPTLRVDQSVAVDGACLTVVACDATSFVVEAVEETLAKTSLGGLRPGAPLNLERALRPDGRLDGHFVLGHVDATGTVEDVAEQSASWLYRIRYPEGFGAYLIPVGSVAVDGISLTLARLGAHDFTVSIIPYTHAHTTIAERWRPGATVNLEFDLIGKYVVGWLERRTERPALSEAWMKAQGF